MPAGRVWMWIAASALLAGAACGPSDEVEVQPLPPLERPTPEVRAGLPEVAGRWRLAGFQLATADTSGIGAGLARPGELWIATQRLDSLAGVYTFAGQRSPLVGEARRDGVLALVAFDPDGVQRFIAGHLHDDTLWIELTSLAAAEGWPTGTRAALVRTPVGEPFIRLPGGALLLPEPDTVVAPTVAQPDAPAATGVVPPRPETRPPPAPVRVPREPEPPAPMDTADSRPDSVLPPPPGPDVNLPPPRR